MQHGQVAIRGEQNVRLESRKQTARVKMGFELPGHLAFCSVSRSFERTETETERLVVV